jgi:benzoyl-CoA 2,3-dioxygenase component B
MVYLLHTYFGRDGRYEAEELLARRSGDADRPRILGAFNQPIENWLDFYMFTTFTDRDGKYQLLALAESGFDPLSRTCRFMLTEEAHHMFVGETGIERVIQRTVEVMRAHPDDDPRKHGALDLPTVQKYLNLWFTLSLDLFGGEVSTNAADFFASGLKGRHQEEKYQDHLALDSHYDMKVVKDGKVVNEQVPMRNAMNEVLRDAYVEDDERCVRKWNRVLEKAGFDFRLRLPDRRFHRHIGIYAGHRFDPDGNLLTGEEWERRRGEWLPSAVPHAPRVRAREDRELDRAPPRGDQQAPLRVGVRAVVGGGLSPGGLRPGPPPPHSPDQRAEQREGGGGEEAASEAEGAGGGCQFGAGV